MKAVSLIAACIMMSGCGAATNDNNSPAPSDTNGSVSPGDVELAKTFLVTHLGFQLHTSKSAGSNISETWEPSDIALTDANWSYKTTEMRSSDGPIEMNIETTSVISFSPSDLSLPIKTGEGGFDYTVELECYTGTCIRHSNRVSVETKPAVEEIGPPSTSNKPVSKTYWTFSDKDEAERVAKALTVVLKSVGAKERKF
jgi:hypothetical protein